jgi:hypothetical protein
MHGRSRFGVAADTPPTQQPNNNNNNNHHNNAEIMNYGQQPGGGGGGGPHRVAVLTGDVSSSDYETRGILHDRDGGGGNVESIVSSDHRGRSHGDEQAEAMSQQQQQHQQEHLQVQAQQDQSQHYHVQGKATLDRAIAPILARPIAPFDKTERKRAHTAAIYYSECVLQGIAPKVADKAAEEADGLHNKWWRRQCAAATAAKAAAAKAAAASSSSSKSRTNNKRESIPEGEGCSDDTDPTYQQPPKRPNCVDRQSQSHINNRNTSNAMDDGEPSDSSIANVVSLSSSATEVDVNNTVAKQQQQQQQQLLRLHHSSRPAAGSSSVDEVEEEEEDDEIMHDVHVHTFENCNKYTIEAVKMQMIDDLRKSGGSSDTPTFSECVSILQHYYERSGVSNTKPDDLVGNWVVLTKPTYSECLGHNQKNEPLYSLGRISFDMYKPCNLICSVQGSFNNVQPIDPKNPGRPLHVPKKLVKEIHRGECNLHTYDISVAITIESGQDRKGQKKQDAYPIGTAETSSSPEISSPENEYVIPKPIKAILTTHGYSLRDPNKQNRLSIWFSGGTLEVQDDDDLNEWRNIFDMDSVPDRDIRERANILAARVLLGAMVADKLEEDGTMNFALRRPIGGHGSVFLDVLYRDDDFRLMRGHHGSVYVCCRVPEPGTFSH